MNNTLFEQFSGKYTRQGDYLLPNLILLAESPNNQKQPICCSGAENEQQQ